MHNFSCKIFFLPVLVVFFVVVGHILDNERPPSISIEV